MLTCGQILDMQLYIPGRLLSQKPPESTVKKLGTHGRITLTYAAMYADKLIASEISQRRGMTLISCKSNNIISLKFQSLMSTSMRQYGNDPSRYKSRSEYRGSDHPN